MNFLKNINNLKRVTIQLSLIVMLLSLIGCAAVNTAVSKRNLETQTQMSSSIFLNPVPANQRTVYVAVRNTSGQTINIGKDIKSQVASKGYHVTDNPNHAHYLLQANILRIGKTNKQSIDNALAGGYGGTLTGAAIGVGTALAAGGGTEAAIGGGLIGGVVGTVTDALVKDELYTMITDVQVSERAAAGQKLKQQSRSVMQQGTSGQETITGGGNTQWMRYRTRVVSTAEKVNLKFACAKPALEKELSKSIAGLF
jgi:hypothetical protein